jgi:hypothetical protein
MSLSAPVSGLNYTITNVAAQTLMTLNVVTQEGTTYVLSLVIDFDWYMFKTFAVEGFPPNPNFVGQVVSLYWFQFSRVMTTWTSFLQWTMNQTGSNNTSWTIQLANDSSYLSPLNGNYSIGNDLVTGSEPMFWGINKASSGSNIR